MKQRIIGFDLARVYAIFGMYIVNFNFCFGSVFQTQDTMGRFLNLFVGNSTAIFILLAGMGISLMTNNATYSNEDKKKWKAIVLKRSWFLFYIGLLLYSWWPGDILHFYGGYLHIAAFVLFVPKKYFLWIAAGAVIVFHVLLFIIPIETSWDFTLYKYQDFWTPFGFLRNTFYNGWNAIFPWLTYFMIGMWLGKLDWSKNSNRKVVFGIGFVLFFLFQGLRLLAKENLFSETTTNYILSEYFPPYIPFMVITLSFAFMVITTCIYIGERFYRSKIVCYLSKAGQMSLSLYVFHLTIGMLLLSKLTGKTYSGYLQEQIATKPIYIFMYAVLFFAFSVFLCVVWKKYFKLGPLETIMRKISG